MPGEGLAQLEQSVTVVPGNTLYLAQLGEAYSLVGKLGQAREVSGLFVSAGSAFTLLVSRSWEELRSRGFARGARLPQSLELGQ